MSKFEKYLEILKEGYIPTVEIYYDIEKDDGSVWVEKYTKEDSGYFSTYGKKLYFKTAEEAKKALQEMGVKVGKVVSKEEQEEQDRKYKEELKKYPHGPDYEYERNRDNPPPPPRKTRKREIDTNHYYAPGKLWPVGD